MGNIQSATSQVRDFFKSPANLLCIAGAVVGLVAIFVFDVDILTVGPFLILAIGTVLLITGKTPSDPKD